MLDKDERGELRDYFEGFTAEEMVDVIQLAKEIAAVKRETKYRTELNELKDKLEHFIAAYGYIDFSSETGVELGLGESAILSTNELVPNTIFFQYPDEKE